MIVIRDPAAAARRNKTTPVRDVAGFLRSLDYAAASFSLSENDAPVRERREGLLARFRRETARAFLEAYWLAVKAAPQLGLGVARAPLLNLMILEKASYEISYEAANRPKWLAIPLRGFAAIANRLKTRERRS